MHIIIGGVCLADNKSKYSIYTLSVSRVFLKKVDFSRCVVNIEWHIYYTPIHDLPLLNIPKKQIVYTREYRYLRLSVFDFVNN